jgi:hypothetical protein
MTRYRGSGVCGRSLGIEILAIADIVGGRSIGRIRKLFGLFRRLARWVVSHRRSVVL